MASKRPGVSESDRVRWNETYRTTRYDKLPWFSAKPYPWIVGLVQRKAWIPGSRLIDIGCGAGTNSLYLAKAGFHVTGIDLAEAAIKVARERAAKAKLAIDFRVGDALQLDFPDEHFGGGIDIGCFHTLPVELRPSYSKEIARVIHPRRTHALSWMARESKTEFGPPHRPSVAEVTAALEDDFLFLRTEYWPSYTGRVRKGEPPVYCAELGRRSFPRPPAR